MSTSNINEVVNVREMQARMLFSPFSRSLDALNDDSSRPLFPHK